MDNPMVEIMTVDSSTILEVPVTAPWTISIKLHLTLKNSSSAVMLPMDLFDNNLIPGPRVKWTLHDSMTSNKPTDPIFSPHGVFSGSHCDAETRMTLLLPNKPTEFWFFPFTSRPDKSATSLDPQHIFEIRLKLGTVPVHATEVKSFLDLARLRREGQPLFSTQNSALPIYLSDPLSFRTVLTCSPWIEVRILPSAKEVRASSDDEFSICLRITLRDSTDSILVDLGPGSVLFSRDTMLRQGGGLLAFTDVQSGIRIQRPRVFIQQAKEPWNVGFLIHNTTTLAPGTSIDVNHILFASGVGVEEMRKEGFAAGAKYDIDLHQPCSIGRWVRGCKTKHAFQKVFSGDWNGEPEWERDAIPVMQRDLLGETVFQVV